MKKFLNVGVKFLQTFVVLALVFAFASSTGNELFAASATVSAGVFSAIMHTSHYMKNGAFELVAPVIPDFTAKSKPEIKELEDEDFEKYLEEKQAYDEAILNKRFFDLESAITEKGEDNSEEQIAELKEKLEEAVKELD